MSPISQNQQNLDHLPPIKALLPKNLLLIIASILTLLQQSQQAQFSNRILNRATSSSSPIFNQPGRLLAANTTTNSTQEEEYVDPYFNPQELEVYVSERRLIFNKEDKKFYFIWHIPNLHLYFAQLDRVFNNGTDIVNSKLQIIAVGRNSSPDNQNEEATLLTVENLSSQILKTEIRFTFTIKENIQNRQELAFVFIKKEQDVLKVRFNGNQQKVKLGFKNMLPVIYTTKYYEPPKKSDKVTTNEVGAGMNYANQTYGYIAFGIVCFMIIFQIDLFFQFLKFFIVTKVLERLKFVNVDLGEMLETFLVEQKDFWYFSNSSNNDAKNADYLVKSRYKLDVYEVPILSFTSLWDKYIIFLSVFVIRFGVKRILRYSRSFVKSSLFDQILTFLSIKLIQVTFLFTVFDILFFTSRNILHQNVFNDSLQTLWSRMNYLVAFIMLSIYIYELCNLYRYDFKFMKLLHTIRTDKDLKKNTDTDIKDLRRRLQSSKEEYMNRNIKKQEVFDKLPIDQKNKVEDDIDKMDKEEIVDFLRYPERSDVTSYYNDLLQKQIKTTSLLQYKLAAFFQVFYITRFCIFEIMFVSIQTNPYMQHVVICLFQFLMVILSGMTCFYYKIFQSYLTGLYNFLFDLLLFIYLITSGVLGFEFRDRFSTAEYTNIQYFCVGLLCMICLLNMIIFFAEIFQAISHNSKRKKVQVERRNREELLLRNSQRVEEGKEDSKGNIQNQGNQHGLALQQVALNQAGEEQAYQNVQQNGQENGQQNRLQNAGPFGLNQNVQKFKKGMKKGKKKVQKENVLASGRNAGDNLGMNYREEAPLIPNKPKKFKKRPLALAGQQQQQKQSPQQVAQANDSSFAIFDALKMKKNVKKLRKKTKK